MRTLLYPSILIIGLLALSCAAPTTPPVSEFPSTQSPGSSSGMQAGGHKVLGMWELIFDFETMTAEAVPKRFAEGHFNVRKFLEEGPCFDCLTLQNFTMNTDETFNVDVQFEHPFPGLDNLSGFDVRGIAIFNGHYEYPGSGFKFSDRTLGDMELLNADGFTPVFNPVDFPFGSNGPLLTYSHGAIATPLAEPATLNGFKAYYPDAERRLFRAGDADTQNYHIAKPMGTPIRVGYVVDASWDIPAVKPVTDPIHDFGPNANCLEPYQVSASIGSGMMPGCGSAPYEIDVYDHQGHATVDKVSFESPGLFNGIIENMDGVDMGGFTRYTGNIPNELEVGEGDYRVLIGAFDLNPDPFLGLIGMYTTATATVAFVPIDYNTSWRKHGKTLDNNNNNVNETEITTSLSELWSYDYPNMLGAVFESTPIIGPFGVYMVVSIPYAEKIWCLDLETGDPVWDRMIKYTPDLAIYRSVPTVGNCEVYVGGSSVQCYDSEDGDIIWAFEGYYTQYTTGGSAVTDGIVVIWADSNTLYGIDQVTGEYIWDYQVEALPGNPTTPVIENGVVYAADMGGNYFALNLVDGSEIWQEQFVQGGPKNRNAVWAQPCMAGGLVWFASYNCRLHGVDPVDGSIDVDVPMGDQVAWSGPAFDGTLLYQPTTYINIYVADFEGPYKIMAVHTDGTVEWEFEGLGDEAFWTTPVVANGIVWAISDAGKIYMLDPADGTQVASAYTLDAPSRAGLTIQDGRLYTIDEFGKVYCLVSE